MKHEGSCHCGGIAFAVEGDIAQAIDCNCSLCRRRGGLLWFAPASAFELRTPRSGLATYRFHTRKLQHRFCPSCGIAPFSEGQGPDGSAMVAINLRCLPALDLGALEVVAYDGAHA